MSQKSLTLQSFGLPSQPEAIHKLITGQNEIEETNDFVKLAHCSRHRFMNPVVPAMETNSKKTRNPEFDIEEYSNQESTKSLVSLFYHP
jgi:hypothetical protein